MDLSGCELQSRRMEPFVITADSRDSQGRLIRRQRRFDAPTRGIRVPKAFADFETRCDAALLAMPSEAVLAEATAARLWRLPTPAGLDLEQIVIVRPSGAWQPRREISHVYRRILRDEEVVELQGRRVTSPARTFADCARTWSFADALALGDEALRRGLMQIDEVTAIAKKMHRLKGLAAAKRVIPLLDARSESPQESRVRAHIIEAGLPLPVPNQRILDEHGGFVAIGDLVYDEWLIVIEYDGAHHRDPLRQAKDATRRTRLREIGFYVVELTADDVRWPQRTVQKVRRALESRGALTLSVRTPAA